jgi:hypothetical protein
VVCGATRFSAGAVLRDSIARRLLFRGFDEVAVLWLDPAATGYDNVNRAALLLSPRGILAITPDGVIHRQRCSAIALKEVSRAAQSVTAAIVLGALLVAPARFLRLFKS